MKIDEYFWTYVRNAPISIFEDMKVEKIEVQKVINRTSYGEILSFDQE